MHGTYTHRVTCNLYPDQHHRLSSAAHDLRRRLAPFLRDAALAYIEKRYLLPGGIEMQLETIQQEIRRIGTNINQIAARANSLQRITHGDLRKAGKLVELLENQMRMLRNVLDSLPT